MCVDTCVSLYLFMLVLRWLCELCVTFLNLYLLFCDVRKLCEILGNEKYI
jgi:hypothetical protein